jgi:acyl-CoA thioester hydrolase
MNLTVANTFDWPIRVYYEDTDAGGVVYYANYLRFMERARTEWLRKLGFEQDVLLNDYGVMFAVRRAEIDYLAAARFNDMLSVRSCVAEVKRASLVFKQQIVSANNQQVLCNSSVKVACVSGAMQAIPIPEQIRERLTNNPLKP